MTVGSQINDQKIMFLQFISLVRESSDCMSEYTLENDPR